MQTHALTICFTLQASGILSDENLLSRLQRAAFDYFLRETNLSNGLVADTSHTGAPASIAVVGFALSIYPVAVERAWITRQEGAERTLLTLRFFWNSPQGEQADATGYKGFYYHFLDMQSGKRVWQCELSLMDSALLLAGFLTASVYFNANTPAETEIRELADALYRRVDWQWAQADKSSLSQGWRPESGFLHYGWEGYNEAILMYVLALASPTYPLPSPSYLEWTSTYQWENLYGVDVLYASPLFVHQFSHAWIDFRGIRDQFMREKHCDYFENSRRATQLQREYARRNPLDFKGYGENCWGFTAGDEPPLGRAQVDGRSRQCFGYTARGVPYGPDDGTIAPWAALASLPFDPEIAVAAVQHFLEHYPDIIKEDRFPSGFNPTLRWISEGRFGLDQGIIVMMIENYRSQLIWKLIRESPYIKRGLHRAGFQGGWL